MFYNVIPMLTFFKMPHHEAINSKILLRHQYGLATTLIISVYSMHGHVLVG